LFIKGKFGQDKRRRELSIIAIALVTLPLSKAFAMLVLAILGTLGYCPLDKLAALIARALLILNLFLLLSYLRFSLI